MRQIGTSNGYEIGFLVNSSVSSYGFLRSSSKPSILRSYIRWSAKLNRAKKSPNLSGRSNSSIAFLVPPSEDGISGCVARAQVVLPMPICCLSPILTTIFEQTQDEKPKPKWSDVVKHSRLQRSEVTALTACQWGTYRHLKKSASQKKEKRQQICTSKTTKEL